MGAKEKTGRGGAGLFWFTDQQQEILAAII
jgi:hypothetical protein